MPNSDYVSSGGGLKLKGVKDAGIKKSKRKKDKSTTSIVTTANEGEGEASLEKDAPQTLVDAHDSADVSTTEKKLTTKTEAERKYDETRRKRLAEKLKRDGMKTHKERVEDFNKALSKLSEHHDMPRIGPG